MAETLISSMAILLGSRSWLPGERVTINMAHAARWSDVGFAKQKAVYC